MIALLLACGPRSTPPPLFARPIPITDERLARLDPVDHGDPTPGECIAWSDSPQGTPADCHGVLGPAVGPEGFAALLDARRRAAVLEPLLLECRDGWTVDRAHCAEQFGYQWTRAEDSEDESRRLRVAVPVVYAGGVVTGTALSVALFWVAVQISR